MYVENIEKYLKRHGFERFSPKAALFDMDGVIYDSMPAHAYAWNKATQEFGLRFTEEDTYANEGMRGEEVIARCMREQKGREATDEEIRTIYARKTQIVAEEFGVLPMMPGTKEFMEKLKAAGLQILVVTGSGQPSTLERVTRDYEGLVRRELIVSSKDCTKGKPDPQPYLIGMERAGVQPWESIVIENAPMGIQAGVAAGAFTIGVNTGPLPDRMLWDAGADLVVKSPAHLLPKEKGWVLG